MLVLGAAAGPETSSCLPRLGGKGGRGPQEILGGGSCPFIRPYTLSRSPRVWLMAEWEAAAVLVAGLDLGVMLSSENPSLTSIHPSCDSGVP